MLAKRVLSMEDQPTSLKKKLLWTQSTNKYV